MVKVVSWLLSVVDDPMFHKKPYNPVLGETMEMWTGGKGGEMGEVRGKEGKEEKEKTLFFAEQVSHHPPILASVVENVSEGVRGEFAVHYSAKFHGNSVSIKTNGTRVITLVKEEHYKKSALSKDTPLPTLLSTYSKMEKVAMEEIEGEKYFFNNFVPDLWMKNVLIGTRRHSWEGEILITCPSTKLQASVKWSEKGEGSYMYPIYSNVIDVLITRLPSSPSPLPFSSFFSPLDSSRQSEGEDNEENNCANSDNGNKGHTPSKQEGDNGEEKEGNEEKKKKKKKKKKSKSKEKKGEEEEGVVARLKGVAGGELWYLEEKEEKGKGEKDVRGELAFSPSNYKEKPMLVLDEGDRLSTNSLSMWGELSRLLAVSDFKGADKVKREVEQNQRKIRKEKEEKDEKHVPVFFTKKYGTYFYKLPIVQLPTKADFAQQN